MEEYEAPTFFIKGGGSGFSDRQKDIFGQLVNTEKETTERQKDNQVFYFKNDEEDPLMDVDNVSKPPRRQCKKFRGKESIFKVPDVPPRLKPSAIPDFKRNPHKWVRYDLGDVSQDDMSEQANRSAAMSFLHELDERRKREMDDDGTFGDGAKPITFSQVKQLIARIQNCTLLLQRKREITLREDGIKIYSVLHHHFFSPAFNDMPRNPKKSSSQLLEKEKLTAQAEEEEEKPHFRSSKLVMPEYIVGEKRPKKKAKRVVKVGSSDGKSETAAAAVKLGHLVDEDEVE